MHACAVSFYPSWIERGGLCRTFRVRQPGVRSLELIVKPILRRIKLASNRQAHLAENQTGIRQPAEILKTTVHFFGPFRNNFLPALKGSARERSPGLSKWSPPMPLAYRCIERSGLC